MLLKSLSRPAHLKEAELLVVNARKLLHRKRDLLSDELYGKYSAQIDDLEATARHGGAEDRQRVEAAIHDLDKSFGKLQPAHDEAGWRENCEVLLVAFVLAIAIRSYFIQPFKIPTGSMEPTLNGIVGHPTPASQPAPGPLRRGLESLWLGRTYVDVVSEVDDQVVQLVPTKHFGFLDYTDIHCASGRVYSVHASADTLTHYVGQDGFGVYLGRAYKAGAPIAHGYVDTGDQVFVDKFTYNFRLPRRGDVFVFDTLNIPTEQRAEADAPIRSEYYIKRLAGTPGDVLRIEPPRLYVNGQLANEPGFRRVMSAKDGYRGYSGKLGPRFQNLTAPAEPFTVPPESYFALGDNSYNSSDSRVWGRVPAENVVGRGLFVYWPFTRHWGFIH